MVLRNERARHGPPEDPPELCEQAAGRIKGGKREGSSAVISELPPAAQNSDQRM
jgi:hypothetical protein